MDLLLIGTKTGIEVVDILTGNYLYQIGTASPIVSFQYRDGLLAVQGASCLELFNFQREKRKKGESIFRKRRVKEVNKLSL